jgi:hypothetical protein
MTTELSVMWTLARSNVGWQSTEVGKTDKFTNILVPQQFLIIKAGGESFDADSMDPTVITELESFTIDAIEVEA